ncbi:rab proteins geranylgeranyltransferase component A 1 isoform X2 [Salmo trutta]|uniref:rab proteins geranylgeranyltransferase component A 1 isoform X2 n=1 Tax=Salmo trutta TaxID=8032 RepID=UPI0011310106|nr:rab proteins geranylgeranyltransferase component A 2-like isoform X2 [Salmo trutta]
MAADNLPSEFDVIILGTGLSESVIAAACSRVGQRVLHVDRRNYYAGNWASFTFNGLLSWIEEYKAGQSEEAVQEDWKEKLEEGEEALALSSMDTSISNLEVFCYASEEPEEEVNEAEAAAAAWSVPQTPDSEGEVERCLLESSSVEEEEPVVASDEASPASGPDAGAEHTQQEGQEGEVPSQAEETQAEEQQASPSPAESQPEPKKKITYTKIVKEGRRFNIDLVSKLMFSRGSLVDLLIKSNVSRYAEFKNVTRILTYRNGKVEQVPCSRADVFGSKQLTVVEKRMLMKFLTFCLDFEQHPEEYQDFSEHSFWDFLQTKKLTDNLQHFILHSIAMVIPEVCTVEGLRATQHFLRCLGRYGNTPFLFPLYGLGEIPQCFCRMCAVFGGIYCLRHSVQCLVLDKESGKCKAVIDTHGQRISCSHFVVEDGYIGADQRKNTDSRQISRAVLITDRSILPSDSEQQISLVTVPPVEPGGPLVRIIELCSSTMTCMLDTYLVHLTCSSASGSAQEDLAPVVSRLFYTPVSPGEEPAEGEEESRGPTVLWALYFNMRDTSAVDRSSYDLPSNVHVCASPDTALGSDHSIKLAEAVFRQLLPDEEFCPPAPNPEDIIYDGDGPQGEGPGFEEAVPAEGAGVQGGESAERQEGKEAVEETEGAGDAVTQETGAGDEPSPTSEE